MATIPISIEIILTQDISISASLVSGESSGDIAFIQPDSSLNLAMQTLWQGEKGDKGENGITALCQTVMSVNGLAGQPVYLSRLNGNGSLASANSPLTAKVVGLIETNTSVGFVANLQVQGMMILPDWTAATGSQFLVSGSDYFLDSASGMLRSSPITQAGCVNTYIGQAISQTALNIAISKPIIL